MSYYTRSSASQITMRAPARQRLCNAHFSPIMLALCLILFSTYYAQNYAGIIGAGLLLAIATEIILQKIS